MLQAAIGHWQWERCDMTNENERQCIHCGKPLRGRQRLFCSAAHKSAHYRQHQTATERKQTELAATNSNELIEARSQLEAVSVVVDTLRQERDTLRSERDSAIGRVSELERENGRLEAQIEASSGVNWERIINVALTLFIVAAGVAVVLAIAGVIG